MMIAMNKSHLESRNAKDSQTSPGQYNCLSPSPPTSPSEINSSVYSSEANADDKDVEKSDRSTHRPDEDKRSEPEMSTSPESTSKIQQGKES